MRFEPTAFPVIRQRVAQAPPGKPIEVNEAEFRSLTSADFHNLAAVAVKRQA